MRYRHWLLVTAILAPITGALAANSDTELAQVHQSIREIDKKIAANALKIRRTRSEILQKNNSLDQRRTEKKFRLDDLSLQEETIAQQARSAYVMSRQSQIKLFLNQDDPSKMARAVTYHQLIYQRNQSRLHELEGQLESLEEVLDAIREEKKALEHLQSDLLFQQKELRQSRVEQEKLVARLQRALADEVKRRQDIVKNDKQLNELTVQVPRGDRASVGMRFAELKGKLSWPVRGHIFNRYGARRPPGDMRWQGAFISAESGEEVRTIAEGEVVFADWLTGYGFVIIVDHGNDYMTLYAHNQALLAKPGDKVKGGDSIATVGNSGGRAQTGVYFEIRAQGKPQNPEHWISSRKFM